ncbi:MAG: DUF3817 domain-containing protein [Cytophagales bacterium]|nr:MAG: DUF3817 domain-containing protein [Cytophagales bacterium]TAF60256.1 MAG: DUF3817 domain-containing protein [Cytophagales bacterium]
MNFSSVLGRLRIIGLIEGISYIVLVILSVGTRFWDWPVEYRKQVGMLHGLLFVLYCGAVLHAWIAHKWTFWRALLAGLVSLLPIGTFVFDASLRKEQEALAQK